MKKFVARSVVVLVVCLFAATLASAKVTSKKVTFPSDVVVNGTLLKSGTYEMKFDDQTGELTLINGKSSVKVQAHWESRDTKARQDSISSTKDGDREALRSITFGGEKRDLVLGKDKGESSASK